MKTTTTRIRTLLAFIGFALVLMGGCKNFMKEDSDFKATIQKAVDVANAEEVTVNVAPSDTGMGSTTPYPTTTAKVGVAFSIAATSDTAYGFIRWAAYIGSTSTDETSGLVTFGDSTAAITSATVNVARSDIYIRPVFAARPTVKKHLPKADSGYYNAAVQYTFSKAMNPASFTFADGTTVNATTGLFKNITIKTTDTDLSLEKLYFGSPSLSADGLVLTIPLKSPATGLLDYKGWDITVVVSRNVVDTVGLTMASNDEYVFTVGSAADTDPPLLQKVQGTWGPTGSLIASYTGSDSGESSSIVVARRLGKVTDDNPFTLILTGSDTGSGIFSATITEYLSYLADGTASSSSSTYNRTLSGSSPYSVRFYSSSNTMGTTDDGYVSLKVKLTDNAGNVGTDSETTYSFIRDTTPPPVDATQIARIAIEAAGSGTAGYYNASNSIPLQPSSVQDYGVDPYRSSTVYYRFAYNTADFGDTTPAWLNASTATTLAVSGYTGSDSLSVPIYFQLKDDLGNTSDVTKLGTVAIDKTKPTGTITATSVTTVNSKQMIGAYDSIPVSVSGADATSGIKYFYAVGGDGETQPTAPTLSNLNWKDYSTIQTATVSVPTDTSGSKHVWVWFCDKANNISEAIKDTQTLVLDNADPVVTKFYLNKSTAFGTTAAPSAQSKQYTKTSSLYFAFTATEATGIGSFAYSTDGGTTWSQYFSATTTAAQTDADHAGYGVSLCNSTEISTGNWLVTGVLTVPATDGNKVMQIKVRDVVRTTSAVSAYTTTANITGVMYDATNPELTGASLTATSNYAGTYAYVGDDDVTLAYTASDAGSGINTRSISGDLATAVTTANLGSTAAEQVAEGLLTVTKSEALTLTSTDGLKAVTVNVSDWAGNSVFKTFQLYLDKTAPTFSTILNQTSSSSTTYTNATPGGVTLYGPTQASKSWTSFYTYMTSHTETGSGFPAGYSQQLRFYRVTPDQVATAVTAGTLTATATGFSGTVVGGDLLTGYTALDNTTSRTTSSNPVLVTYNLGKTITLPVDSTLGRPLSGYYVVGFRALDNLGNTSAEQKTGYFYDQTPPVISKVEVYDGTTLLSPYNNGTYNIIKAPASNHAIVRLYVTDRPSGDPNGSGISSLAPHIYYRTNGANDATASGGYQDTAQSIAESAAGYVTVNFGSLAYWDVSAYQYLILHATVSDVSGNANATKYDYPLAMDNANPTYTTVSWPDSYSGAVSGISYINTSTATFTPSDPVTFYMASGVSAWALTSSSSAPGDASTDWQTYTSGTAVASDKLSDLIGSSSSPVYLHIKDKVGNVSSYALGTMCLDMTDPVITDKPEIATDSAFASLAFTTDTTHWYTNKTRVYIRTKANDRANDSDGSGIKKIVTTCSADSSNPRTVTIASPAQTETADTRYQMANSDTTGGYWDGYTGMTSAWNFYSKIYDAVENYSTTPTCYLYYDGAKPTVSGTVTKNYTTTVDTTEFCGSATTLSFSAVDAASFTGGASGIAAWGIKTSDTAPGVSAAAVAGSWTGWQAIASPATGTGAVPITTAAGVVSGLVSGTTTLSIFLKDNAGNVSEAILAGTYNIDNTAPSVKTIIKIAGSKGRSDLYYVNSSASLAFTAEDNTGGSGMNRYYISALNTESDAVVNGTATGSGIGGTYPDTGWAGTVTVSSLLSTVTGTNLYLYIADKVGNVTQYGVVTTNSILLDSTNPGFSTPDSGNYVVLRPFDHTSLVSSAGKPSLSSLTDQYVKFFVSNSEVSGSGISRIELSGSYVALTNTGTAWAAHYSTGTGSVDRAGTYTPGDSVAGTNPYFTLSSVYTGTAPLFLTGVDLLTGSSISVTVTIYDAAGNSATRTSQSLPYDSYTPTFTSSTLADSSPVLASYCNDVSPTLTLTMRETSASTGTDISTASGISVFTFTGLDFTNSSSWQSGVSVSVNGTSYTTSTSNALTLSTDASTPTEAYITLPDAATAAAKGSSVAIIITGLRVSTTDELKTITVTASDAAGNESLVLTKTITLDSTPPSTSTLKTPSLTTVYPFNSSVSTGGTVYTSGANVGFTVGATDSTGIAGYYAFAAADTTLTPVASTTTTTLTLNKGSTYYIYAKDNVGIYSATPFIVTVTQDTTAPSTATLTTPTSTTVYPSNSPVSTGDTVYTSGTDVGFTAAESSNTGGSGIAGYYAYTTNSTSGSLVATSSGTTLTLAPSATPYYVFAKDNVGNYSDTAITVTVTADNTNPSTAKLTTPTSTTVSPSNTVVTTGGTVYTSGTSVSFTVAETSDTAGSGIAGYYAYTTNSTSGSLVATSSGTTLTLAPSATPYYVFAKDNVGNYSDTAITVTVTADNTNPSTAKLTTPTSTTVSPSNTVVTTGGTVYTSGTSVSFTVAETSDTAGSGIAGYYAYTTNSTSGSLVATSSGTTLTLAPSATPYYVFAKDNVGNYSDTAITVTVTADNTNPSTAKLTTPTSTTVSPSNTVVTTGGTVYTSGTSVSFTVAETSDTAGSGIAGYYAYTTNSTSGSLVATSSGTTLTLAPSATPYYVFAKDNVGNYSDTAITVTVTADNTNPSTAKLTTPTSTTVSPSNTVVTTGGTVYTSGTSVSFTVAETSDTAGSGIAGYYAYTTNSTSGSLVATSSGTTLTLAPSATPYYVFAKDNVGNYSDTAITVTVTADNTNPSTAKLTTPTSTTVSPSNTVVTTGGTVYTSGTSVSFTVAETSDTAGSGIAGYYAYTTNSTSGSLVATSSGTTLTLAPSATPYYVFAKDNVGNYSDTAITVTVTADNTNPSTAKLTTPTSTTVSPSNTVVTTGGTVYTSGTSVSFTVAETSDTAGSGIAGYYAYTTNSTSGSLVATSSGTTLTLAPSATPYYVFAKDNVGNYSDTAITVTVTADNTNPSTAKLTTPTSTTVSPSNTVVTTGGTVYTSGTSVSFTVAETSDTAGSGIAGYYAYTTNSTSGSLVATSSGTTLTLAPSATPYYVFAKDNVGNYSDTAITVTVTADNTPPAWTSSWSGTTTLDAASLATDGGSSIATVKIGGTQYPSSDTFASSFSSAAVRQLIAMDNVGNSLTAYLYITASGVPTVRVNKASTWGISLSGTITISNLGVWGANSGSATYTSTSPLGGATGADCVITIASDNITGIVNPGAGYTSQYDLVLSPDSGTNKFTMFSFTITGAATSPTVASIVALGNTVLAPRLITSIVTSEDNGTVTEAMSLSGKALVNWNDGSAKHARAASISKGVSEKAKAALLKNAIDKEDLGVKQAVSSLSLSSLHSLQLARAREKQGLGASQNTEGAQTAADNKKSPELSQRIKQDDASGIDGVYYNKELVRFAGVSMTPLAQKYLALHGVSLDGDEAAAGVRETGQSSGLPSGPVVGMIGVSDNAMIFRREMDSGLAG